MWKSIFKTVAPGRAGIRISCRPAGLFWGTLLSSLLLANSAGAACVCGYGDGKFTTVSAGEILIDGTMADWGNVLADLDNNSCDDQGTELPSADRDYPVQSTGRDLIHFAYTWDDTNIYAYTERSGSASNKITFVYYADTDNDGIMESGEPVVLVEWQGNTRNINLSIADYAAANAGGDPMTDGNGYSDGYTLPGTLVNTTYYDSLSGGYGGADGMNMEWAVPWSLFGLPAGAAFTFHVSSSNSTNIPAQIDDSMGGCGGGPASTQYADLTFTPDRTIQTPPQTTVYAAHVLTNTGNGSDTFNFSATSSGLYTPTTIAYYRDLGTVGQYDAGTDTLLTDTDSDGLVDTGSLAADGAIDILAAYTIPAGASGAAAVAVTATSAYDNNISATVTDQLQVASPNLTVIKSASGATAAPGQVITYTVTVLNAGNAEAANVVLTDDMSPYTAWELSSFTLLSGDSGLTQGTAAFSADGGSTYNYTPVSGSGGAPVGYDGTVTDWQLPMTGNMAAGGSFTLRYKAMVK